MTAKIELMHASNQLLISSNYFMRASMQSLLSLRINSILMRALIEL
jgi:hypothetical protein